MCPFDSDFDDGGTDFLVSRRLSSAMLPIPAAGVCEEKNLGDKTWPRGVVLPSVLGSEVLDTSFKVVVVPKCVWFFGDGGMQQSSEDDRDTITSKALAILSFVIPLPRVKQSSSRGGTVPLDPLRFGAFPAALISSLAVLRSERIAEALGGGASGGFLLVVFELKSL